MSEKCLLLAAAALMVVAPAYAQLYPGCPVPLAMLKAMRNCYRSLLVVAPSGCGASFVSQ